MNNGEVAAGEEKTADGPMLLKSCLIIYAVVSILNKLRKPLLSVSIVYC